MKICPKVIFLFFIFLSIPLKPFIAQQSFTLGGGINVKVQGPKSGYGVGLNLSGEYRFTQLLAGRLNSSFIISAFRNSLYFGTDSYTQGSYEGNILVYPFSGRRQLYAGAGIGYYVLNTNLAGNPHWISGGNYFGGYAGRNVVDNSLGYNLLAGIKFNAENPFSVSLEFKYIFLNPDAASYIYYQTRDIAVVDNIELSTLQSTLSFNYRF